MKSGADAQVLVWKIILYSYYLAQNNTVWNLPTTKNAIIRLDRLLVGGGAYAVHRRLSYTANQVFISVI